MTDNDTTDSTTGVCEQCKRYSRGVNKLHTLCKNCRDELNKNTSDAPKRQTLKLFRRNS